MRWTLALMFSVAGVAMAADRWIPVSETPGVQRTLLNVGYVVLNGNGNRVATLRSIVNGGFKMDILTEFDCRARKQRALSTSTTDKDGHLIGAAGRSNSWFAGEEALGLSEACSAPLAKP